jgi:large repetitive protein
MNFSLVFLLFILLTACGYKSDVGLVSETPAVRTVESPTSGTYNETDTITITVNFNRIVIVSGTPCLKILLDSGEVCADYVSGSDSRELTFSYTIQNGDQDADGIRLDEIDLNGGSILDKKSREASLNYTAGDTSQIIVATTPPSTGPVIQSVTPVYTNLKTGDYIEFRIVYDQEVLLSLGSIPQLTLSLESGTVYADYVSGSTTRTLIFKYRINPGEFDTNGLTLGTTIDLKGMTLTNLSGNNNADISFSSIVTSNITVDGLDPVLSSISTPSNGYYRIGEELLFSLNFSTQVIVNGIPRIPLTIGSTTRYATYQGGSGSDELFFSYDISGSLEDHNGIEIGNIDLNSGSIKDFFGDDAVLSHTTPTPNLKVDTIPPTISSLSVDAGTFREGETIGFHATFSEAVTAESTYYISFNVASTSRQAIYSSGNSSSNLTFNFEVPADDYDTDGIVINLNHSDPDMGSIVDLAGNQLSSSSWPAPSLRPLTLVDARASISSIDVPSSTTAKTGTHLDFYVNFARSVTVTGSPRLTLNVGGVTKYASFLSGSGSDNLTFRYTVLANDVDSNGLEMLGPLDLNGGSILSGSTPVKLGFSAPDTSTLLVDGIDSQILSISATDGNYKLTGQLDFTIQFSHPTTVTGSPQLPLTVGVSTLYASYVSGSGTDTHTYSLEIRDDHLDLDGPDLAGTSLNLNSGTIKDAFGDNASITFSAQNFPNIRIDGIAPTISSITAPASSTYTLAQELTFLVNYSEVVKVTGTPRLALTIGSTTVYAQYVDGSDSDILTFKYNIESGLSDTDGIAMATTVDLNGGSITDRITNSQVNFNFTAPTLTGVLVNSVVPTITGITGPSAATYNYNQTISFDVTFSQRVNVTGTPVLDLDIAGSLLSAHYVSGSGTFTLTFSYQITTAGLSDLDGVITRELRQVSGSTIKNASGSDADLSLTPTTFSSVLVDTTGLLLLSVTTTPDRIYKVGGTYSSISFVVNFSEAVTVTGTPKINTNVGGNSRPANYSSGSGTTALTFTVSTLTVSDLDLDGISCSSSITLNGGTIRSTVGNVAPASLSFIPPDLSKVYVARTEFSHWYDFSNQSSIVLSGSNIVSIQDRIGTTHLTYTPVTGAPYHSTGFMGTDNAYVGCSTSGYFSPGVNTTSPVAAVIVYRAPPTVVSGTSQLMLGGTSSDQFRIDFYSTSNYKIRAGGAPPYASTYKTSTGWVAPSVTIDYLNAWSENAYAITGWKWSTTSSFDYKVCQFDGEISELILFDSFSISNADTEILNTYLFNKYGMRLPP